MKRRSFFSKLLMVIPAMLALRWAPKVYPATDGVRYLKYTKPPLSRFDSLKCQMWVEAYQCVNGSVCQKSAYWVHVDCSQFLTSQLRVDSELVKSIELKARALGKPPDPTLPIGYCVIDENGRVSVACS